MIRTRFSIRGALSRFRTYAEAMIRRYVASMDAVYIVQVFLVIVTVRLLAQWWIEGFVVSHAAGGWYIVFAESVTVYAMAIALISLVLSASVRVSLFEATAIATIGLSVIIVAPFLEHSIGNGNISLYELSSARELWQSYLTAFGLTPDIGITVGYRAVLVLSATGAAIYAYIRRRRLWRAVVAAWGVYTVFFFVGALPSLVTLGIVLIRGEELAILTDTLVAKYFLSQREILGHVMPTPAHALLFRVSIVAIVISAILTCILWLRRYRIHSMWHREVVMIVYGGMVGAMVSLTSQISLQSVIGGNPLTVFALGTLVISLCAAAAFFVLHSSVLRWGAAAVAIGTAALLQERLGLLAAMIIALGTGYRLLYPMMYIRMIPLALATALAGVFMTAGIIANEHSAILFPISAYLFGATVLAHVPLRPVLTIVAIFVHALWLLWWMNVFFALPAVLGAAVLGALVSGTSWRISGIILSVALQWIAIIVLAP